MDINVFMKNPARPKDVFARVTILVVTLYTFYKVTDIELRLNKIEKGLKELKPDEEA